MLLGVIATYNFCNNIGTMFPEFQTDTEKGTLGFPETSKQQTTLFYFLYGTMLPSFVLLEYMEKVAEILPHFTTKRIKFKVNFRSNAPSKI